MLFQTLSGLSFHQLSSWAICFLYSLWPHLLSVPCVCCGTNCTSLDREIARALGQKNPFLWLLVLKSAKEKPVSLDFLPISVATWNADLLSNVFGHKRCPKSWQSWVRSYGRRWWSRSLWKLSLQAEGSRRGEERHRMDTKGRKTRNRDHAKRGHKEVKHREEGAMIWTFVDHRDRKTNSQ